MSAGPHQPRDNFNLDSALADAQAHYTAHNPKSAASHLQAYKVLPGGNSRTVLHFDPFPLTMSGGEGATVRDIDDHGYIDFIGEYTAGLFGHRHPLIQQRVTMAMRDGILLCGPTEHEQQFAGLICERYPSVDRVRFCNSGTEANLMAITAARAFTGKSHIMVCNGAYHGGVFLFANGNNANNAPYPFVLAPYNDIEGATKLLAQHADHLAAVLIEPMMGTAGAIAADKVFLVALREACSQYNILLIFDEVMTSRLSRGGAQHLHRVTPDMTSFGKYMGGGMSFGAFGGRAEIIDQFDPRRADCLPHAGTFNNNVLTMSAGTVALGEIYTAEVADAFTEKGELFCQKLQVLANKKNLPVQISGVGTLMCVHFSHLPITTPEAAKVVNPKLRNLFQLAMIDAGFYISKLGYIALMLPLTDEHYHFFYSAFEQFLVTYDTVIKDSVID